jgi:hypothetical protein
MQQSTLSPNLIEMKSFDATNDIYLNGV